MQGVDRSFSKISEDIQARLQDFKSSLGDLELEIKVAGLKSTKNQEGYNKLLDHSKKHLQILNFRNDHRFHKINAMATEKQLINLEDNLEGLLKKPMHKLEKIRGININHHFERFLFDIGDKGWHSVHKESLLQRQYDIISHQIPFRLNICEKVQKKEGVEQTLKKFLMTGIPFTTLRYMQVIEHHLDEFCTIVIDKVYQTEDEQDYEQIRKAVLESEGTKKVEEIINETLDEHLKSKKGVKVEIQIHFQEACLKFLVKQSLQEVTKFLTEKFEFFRDLLELHEDEELKKLMEHVRI